MTNTHIQLISDCSDPFAFNQVLRELRRNFGEEGFTYGIPQGVPSFNTTANAFLIADYALNAVGPTVVFHNVAPREDDPSPRFHNEGEPYAAVVLNNGTIVVGPNSGYSLSLIKSEVDRYFDIAIPLKPATQFRSRDKFPELAARFFRDDELDKRVVTDIESAIPDLVRDTVLFVDSFGNIKTNITHPDEEPGTEVGIQVGPYLVTATVGGGAFHIPQDGKTIGLTPGSNTNAQGEAFYELFFRGGRATDHIRDEAELADQTHGRSRPDIVPGTDVHVFDRVPERASEPNGSHNAHRHANVHLRVAAQVIPTAPAIS